MVTIVGHRGAEGYAPENTLLSFQKAIEIGCQRTELDVRLSRDDEVIVIHDANVDRTTNGKGFVNEMTLEEIKKLNCPRDQKIPTLQEVIDLCKGRIDLQIELKAKGTPKIVNDLILQNKILHNVVVSSFEIDLLQEIKSINSKLKVLFLFTEYSRSIWDFVKKVPLDYIGPKSSIVTKEMINKAHTMEVLVYAFHVNVKSIGNSLIELGVDDIGTNFPKFFINSVKYNY